MGTMVKNFAIVGMTVNTANFCREMIFWEDSPVESPASLVTPTPPNKYLQEFQKDIEYQNKMKK